MKQGPVYLVIAVSGLLATLLSGCSDPERQKIVGVWEIETADKLIDRVGAADPAPESATAPMTIEMKRNGDLTTTTRVGDIGKVKTGQWELLRAETDRSFVSCTLSDQHVGTQTTELEIEWVDADTIRMTPPNLAGLKMKLRFKRKK